MSTSAAPVSASHGHAADHTAAHTSNAGADHGRTTWERLRPQVLKIVGAYAVLTAVWVAMGLIIKGPLSDTGLQRLDDRISRWMVDRRSPFRDDVAWWAAHMADTFVKIIATAILAGIFLALWRRWNEAALVAVSLILEASVFLTVTLLVKRPRPDVPRLESSPVSSSFPSGHTAAAAVYAALAVIVFWHTRNRIARTIAVLFSVAMPAAVGVARLYAGMHALTDIVAGALLGFTTLFVVAMIVGRPKHTGETGQTGGTDRRERAQLATS
jgi:undecaprenyl-diphosphatase